jgi:NADH-quinone oxidoreductase subunit H
VVVLKYLFNILIFPGFLFCFIAGLLLTGIDRKLVARMQRRIGAPIFQPFYDFFKLLGKETIIPRETARITFLAAPVIGLIALVTVALFIPIPGLHIFSGVADLIVVLYLLTIPSVALIIGGSASGSPFAAVGISREMVAIISYELPLVISLLAVGKKVGGDALTFSLAKIMDFQALNGPMITNWALIPAALAMLLVIPCKVGSLPFDVAEAEIEICEGPLVEYSGAPLGLFKLNHAIKMLVVTSLFVTLFLSGKGLFLGGTSILVIGVNTIIQFLLAIVVVAVCISFLKAITARVRVEQMFKFYWTYPTALAILSFVLVWLGF